MIVAKTSEKTNYSQYSTIERYVTRGSTIQKIFFLSFLGRILLFKVTAKIKKTAGAGDFRLAEKEGFEQIFILKEYIVVSFKHA